MSPQFQAENIYILIVENYKANWRRRIASPLMWHVADYAQASLPCRRREATPRDLPGFFSRNENQRKRRR